MQYRVIRTEDLEHGLFSKAGAKLGSTWDKHKYIAKQKVGDGYRYFYSQAELAAAKVRNAGQRVKTSISDVKNYASKVNRDRSRYKEAISKANSQQGRALSRYGKASVNKESMKAKNASNAASRALDNSSKYTKALNEYNENVNEFKYRASTALNEIDDKISKGKKAINDIISKTANISSSAINKGKSFAEKLGLIVSDNASKAVGAIATQIDLAKNKKREISTQRSMDADAKQKKAALDEANEKLALTQRERKEKPYKHIDEHWDIYEEMARDKVDRARFQYELADDIATQYEPKGKTSHDWYDSDVGGRRVERTSEQRKNDIKNQNRYKYDREYREKIDSERDAAYKKYEQLSSQFETIYKKESEAEKKYGRDSDEYKKLNNKAMDLLYKIEDARDDVFNYDIITSKAKK